MNGLQRKVSSSIVLLLLSLNAAFTPGPNQACLAQESGGECVGCSGESAATMALPDCTDCIWCRSSFTGDWLGHRDHLAENGVTFEGDVTQYYQGVAAGGLEQDFKYGGHADYVVNMDLGKLGAWQGLFLTLRGESQFAEFVNRDTGALLATNTEGLIPTAGGQETALTNVLLTQFMSEKFAVFAGKLDTFDGDMNAFAHGRGKNQFMNVALVGPPVAFRTVPYSTYGAGFTIVRELEPIFTFTVMDPVDHATTGPGDLFAEGVTLNPELRLPTCFLGRPGHQLVGGTWSSREVAELGRLIVPPGVTPQRSDSWSLYYNFDQYLVVDPCDPTHGWGVFGRAGIADKETHALDWLLSFGIGGNSPISGRESDTFGVGWYYSSTSDELRGSYSAIMARVWNCSTTSK